MSKLIIKKPQMMDGANGARFKPKVIIACLISLAIFVAYNVVATIIGLIYIVIEIAEDASLLRGTFSEILNSLYDIILSQTFILIAFFSSIVLIGFVIIQIKHIDKRKLSTLGFSKKNVLSSYFKGLAFGTLTLLLLILPTLVLGFDGIVYNGFTPVVIVFLFAFVIQSAAEEILFRGYLLTTLFNRIGVFWAVLLSSAVFALLHVVNGGMTVLMITQVFLLGAFFGFYVVRTNNIWGACGMHFAWNFLQGLFTSITISGIKIDYSIITFVGIDFESDAGNIFGNPADLIPITILLAAIAVVLFVGKNKIAVRKPADQIGTDMY